MGSEQYGIHKQTIDRIVFQIKQVCDQNVQLAVVIGGGNIFRGVALGATGLDRATADYMGMIATVMNALALQDAMMQAGIEAKVQSAIRIDQIVEPYIRQKAIRHLSEKKVVIFAAGTGNPLVTTDSAASLRGIEVGADVVVKATNVDGVYDRDPNKHTDAVLYQHLDFDTALKRELKVMDLSAFCQCRDYGMPLHIFNITKPGALMRVITGEDEGTAVRLNKKGSD